AQQFSALEYALGEDLFRAFADDYLASHPSTHYNLAELGRRFPAYLQANRPDAQQAEKEDWIDFVIELATFEYDLSELFDRPAEEGYRLAAMSDADDEIELVPTGTLFRFQFPVNTFYTQFKKGEGPELPFAAPSYCVVLRHDYRLAVYELQPDHYEFLGLLAQGMTVAVARAAFTQRHNIAADAFAQMWPVWKQNWVRANLLRVRMKTC
ncbi:MAG: DNA-binding domain-containing protein, partial [Bacteroidota bacterium]|nr:DNA-binding domain-containing protein [Bacteroidota bacterium]